MQLDLGVVQRREEREALQVVEMKVTQHDVDDAHIFGHQARTKSADARTRIEDGDRTVRKPQLYTRRVAAVAHCRRAGRRDRPPTSPDSGQHCHVVAGQNATRTPAKSSGLQNSGIAENSTSLRSPSGLVTRLTPCDGRRSSSATTSGSSLRSYGVPSGLVGLNFAAHSPWRSSPVCPNWPPKATAAASL